jgi:uncharacterized protein (DUF2249 family)
LIQVKAGPARPRYRACVMSKKVVTLDVREDIRRGREPFSRIMQAVACLNGDEDLLLLAPFEPVPLFGVLALQGFAHQAKPLANGDFEVRFSREPLPPAPGPAVAPTAGSNPGKACTVMPVVEVDARGLEPPQPLVKILEALATLPEGARLRAHTERRPMHLYAQLEERGFVGETEEQKDGTFVTYVRRR